MKPYIEFPFVEYYDVYEMDKVNKPTCCIW